MYKEIGTTKNYSITSMIFVYLMSGLRKRSRSFLLRMPPKTAMLVYKNM